MSIVEISPVAPDTPLAANAHLRVLHVINGEVYAGAERVQDLLAMHLERYHVECGFACVKPDRFASRRLAQEIPLWPIPVRHPFPYGATGQLINLIRTESFDVVHSHTPRSAWVAIPAAIQAGIPAVHTLHDVSLGHPDSWLARLVHRRTRQLLQRAQCVVGVSSATLEIAEELCLGSYRQMVPNGVPARAELEPRSFPTEWTIGTVALMRPCKGVEVLIRAVARLRRRGQPVRLRLVGGFISSQYEASLRQLIDDQQLTPHTTFTGFTSQVDQELKRLDLFVLPSLTAEGMPMVVLEAMAAGVPVLGSRVAGITDLIRDGVDGRLFEPSSDQCLAEKIGQLLDDPDHGEWMRWQAFQRQRRMFSADTMASRMANVYHHARRLYSASQSP